MRDILLYGLSQSDELGWLTQWAQTTKGLHDFVPDYHRLQLEHWIWSRRADLGKDILDVGVDQPRRWLGPGYISFGESGSEDIQGDLLAPPFYPNSFDGIILTEVLEHCTDPKAAVAEVLRVLRPGGLLLVTSPFIWVWHGTTTYKDYWRFTHQGWELLLQDFDSVQITPCAWTAEGAQAFDLVRRFECLGFRSQTTAATGYLCEARKHTQIDPTRDPAQSSSA